MNTLVTLALVGSLACQGALASWHLVWEDNFEGTHLNETSWTIANNFTHGTQEHQLYMADDVYLDGKGHLVLRTQKRDMPYGSTPYHYTSGWVSTEHKFSHRYGRFEIRAQLPSPLSVGIWPAHWLMPEPEASHPPNVCWPKGGEIDILEAYGHGAGERYDAFGTFHWSNKSCGQDCWDHKNGAYPPSSSPPIDFSADYHTFAVDYSATSLHWSVDGHYFWQRTPETVDIPHNPMYVILNTAISWFVKGSPSGLFPVYHSIDYVKVFDWAD